MALYIHFWFIEKFNIKPWNKFLLFITSWTGCNFYHLVLSIFFFTVLATKKCWPWQDLNLHPQILSLVPYPLGHTVCASYTINYSSRQITVTSWLAMNIDFVLLQCTILCERVLGMQPLIIIARWSVCFMEQCLNILIIRNWGIEFLKGV